MKYALLILSPPASPCSATAIHFATELLHQGHEIIRIFFLDQGVGNALATSISAQDEAQRVNDWAALATEHKVELIACVSSALKYGVLDEREAQRHERSETMHQAFSIGGLGLLVEASATADRLFTFGG